MIRFGGIGGGFGTIWEGWQEGRIDGRGREKSKVFFARYTPERTMLGSRLME